MGFGEGFGVGDTKLSCFCSIDGRKFSQGAGIESSRIQAEKEDQAIKIIDIPTLIYLKLII